MARTPEQRAARKPQQRFVMELEAFIALGKASYDLYGRRTDRLPAPTRTHPLTEERIQVLQRRAELRQPLHNPADENRPAPLPHLIAPCDEDDETLVSMAQMAHMVGLSSQRLRHHIRTCRGAFPGQVEQHASRGEQGPATCAYWLYREVRPWLEDLFGLTLPARYRRED